MQRQIAQPVKRFQASFSLEIADQLLEQARKEYRSMNAIISDALVDYFKAHSNDPDYIPPTPRHPLDNSSSNNPLDKDICLMTESELRAKAAQMNMTYEEICQMRDGEEQL